MSKTITVQDIVNFILENKKDKVFINQTLDEIVLQVYKGVEDETIFYSTDEDGKVNGMVLAELRPDEGVLFITENLAMSLKTLKNMATTFGPRFKGYRLEWLKHGIYKQHNTDKVYKKLSL